jgi:hypothetical protein
VAKVVIINSLKDEILKKFKQDSISVFEHLKSLEKYPDKGKSLGSVGGIVVKEVKYNSFRFYFITDGHILKFGREEDIASLLIKFVRMSDKKDQQKVISEIKSILKSMGFEYF